MKAMLAWPRRGGSAVARGPETGSVQLWRGGLARARCSARGSTILSIRFHNNNNQAF
jgi:hypothetical protein